MSRMGELWAAANHAADLGWPQDRGSNTYASGYDVEIERVLTDEELAERAHDEAVMIEAQHALHLAELHALAVARGNAPTTTNQRDAA